jgi:hypothetical protein
VLASAFKTVVDDRRSVTRRRLVLRAKFSLVEIDKTLHPGLSQRLGSTRVQYRARASEPNWDATYVDWPSTSSCCGGFHRRVSVREGGVQR